MNIFDFLFTFLLGGIAGFFLKTFLNKINANSKNRHWIKLSIVLAVLFYALGLAWAYSSLWEFEFQAAIVGLVFAGIFGAIFTVFARRLNGNGGKQTEPAS